MSDNLSTDIGELCCRVQRDKQALNYSGCQKYQAGQLECRNSSFGDFDSFLRQASRNKNNITIYAGGVYYE